MTDIPREAGKTSYELLDPDMLFTEMGLRPGQSLLDLGCGPGRYSLDAAGRVGPEGRVLGLDLWPDGIEMLKSQAGRLGLTNLEARVADIASPELEIGERFDLVIMATVLHDLAERGQAGAALANTARFMKPGGRLAVVEFVKKEGRPGPPASVKLSPKEVEELARPQGLEVLKLAELNQDMYLSLLGR